MTDFHSMTEKKMGAIEAMLAPIFAKAPHLPQSAREGIVKVAPWLALVFGILGLLAIPSLGGFGILLSFSFLGGGSALFLFITVAIAVVTAILDLLAYSPLSQRKKRGWNYVFYGQVLSVVSVLVQFFTGYGALGGLVGVIIGFWLLFEVRGMYTA